MYRLSPSRPYRRAVRSSRSPQKHLQNTNLYKDFKRLKHPPAKRKEQPRHVLSLRVSGVCVKGRLREKHALYDTLVSVTTCHAYMSLV